MADAWTVEEANGTSQTAKGLRILLVEDHADSAVCMAMLLRMNGHKVMVAMDGLAALNKAQEVWPDVVLLDIDLPGGIDGYEVAKRLQERKVEKKPLLVAVTGFGGEDDRRRSSEAGFDLHLVKPTDPDNLLRLLRKFQDIIDR